jgi:ketosteroid isomerase-like protein
LLHRQCSDQGALRSVHDRLRCEERRCDHEALRSGQTATGVRRCSAAAVRGWDAYKKDWQDFFAGYKGPVKLTISDLSYWTDGDLGFGYSIQRVVGTDTKGNPSDMTVRVTDAYRKIGGKWLIVHEHVSVPVNLDTMKPDIHSMP